MAHYENLKSSRRRPDFARIGTTACLPPPNAQAQAIRSRHPGRLSKRTVERMEAGGPAQLVSLVRVCRALGQVEHFDPLVPEPVIGAGGAIEAAW